MRYTQESFKDDLFLLEDALTTNDQTQLGVAIARAESLLKAGGQKGSIVSGANRLNLQRLLTHCKSHAVGVAGLGTTE